LFTASFFCPNLTFVCSGVALLSAAGAYHKSDALSTSQICL